MQDKSVQALLRPQAIAVIGVSQRQENLGRNLYDNLVGCGFQGETYAINPKGEVAGISRVYVDISRVPKAVDLAFVVVPQREVLPVITECGENGVKAVILVSAGFGELGEEGRKEEQQIQELAERYQMRLVGPNCMGVMNTALSLNGTFSPVYPPRGNVALCSQSGSLGQAIMDYAASLGIGLSSFVSVGNRIDVDESDLVAYWMEDAQTQVILLYMENFLHAGRLLTVAEKYRGKKPILALQGGATEAGVRAVQSHTGSLAGSKEGVRAFFERAGILQVATLNELFGVTSILSAGRIPRGNRVAIMTNAGGPGILAADQCQEKGLVLAKLNPSSRKALRALLPPQASLANPIDMIASADARTYTKVLTVLQADRRVDAVIVIFINPVNRIPREFMKAIVAALDRQTGKKPVLVNFLISSGRREILEVIVGKHLPIFSFPEQAVEALARVWELKTLTRQGERVRPLPTRKKTRSRFHSLIRRTAKPWLQGRALWDLLAAYGIPVVPHATIRTPEALRKAAKRLGYPLALKVEGILHKSEQMALRLHLEDETSLLAAFREFRKKFPRCREFLLQRMVREGLEVVAGVARERDFGHLMMVGLGGTEVELHREVAFALHPLTRGEIERLLQKTALASLLQGFRGRKPMDQEAFVRCLLRLSALVADFPEIQEMDLNPIKVLPKGRGCFVVDARIKMGRG